jgi:NADPH:quinone reductase-like Zn-dependent oxidoreductase
VREVGPDGRRFKAGDEIYARVEKDRLGGFAERAVVREEHAGRKPARLSFEDAAAVPLAGLTAWQALVDDGRVSEGQKVLIHAGARAERVAD